MTERSKAKLRRYAIIKAKVLLAAEAANVYAQSGKHPTSSAIKKQAGHTLPYEAGHAALSMPLQRCPC